MRGNLITYFPRYWMVAFAGASLAYGNALINRFQVASFVFLGIFLVYNRYLSLESRYGIIGKSMIISLLIACLSIGVQQIASPVLLFSLIVSGMLGYFYTQRLPIIGIALRDIPGLKTGLVVGVWTYVTCLLPVLMGSNVPSIKEYALPGFFILAISLLFDLRDREIDDVSRKTIPQLIGVLATKILVVVLLITYLFLIHIIEIQVDKIWAYSAVIILLVLLVWFKNTKSSYYASLLEFILVMLGVGYW
jgi:hypothetical protein